MLIDFFAVGTDGLYILGINSGQEMTGKEWVWGLCTESAPAARPQAYPGGMLRLSLERYRSVRERLSRDVRELLSTGLLDKLKVDSDCD